MIREHQSNRLAWNEAAEYYKKGLEEAIELLRGGGMNFLAPELKYLKEFGKKLDRCIHLQCAGGTDTLSLINYGAKEVVGVDISEPMLQIAQTKSNALKMNAQWVHSDVLNVPTTFDATADLVYTGKGAINWIMDIQSWAKVVSRILKPGAILYLFEGHPFTYSFDPKASELKVDAAYEGYFSQVAVATQDWPSGYVGQLKESVKDQATKYERAWPLSDVITALLQAGLVLERFEEHPDKYYEEFENLPDELRIRIPNTYSIVARKPF
jgi:ubiquinone/menaquinone biosynthesis C-methylase UbiE